MNVLDILLYLGKIGAIDKPIPITSIKIACKLGVSQQSVSRWLIDLERKKMIFRQKGIKGYLIQLSPAGKKYLQNKGNEIDKLLTASKKLLIQGKVVSGMDDGKYYLGFKKYSQRIKSKLGFKPYPGTLNIKLHTLNDIRKKEKLDSLEEIKICGFKKGDRTFGSAKCFPCKILGVKGAVIIPKRSHYGSDILEVISASNLRKQLKLKNGGQIKVEVTGFCQVQYDKLE